MESDDSVTITVTLGAENDHQYGVVRGDDLVWLPKAACKLLKPAAHKGGEMTVRVPAELAKATRLA